MSGILRPSLQRSCVFNRIWPLSSPLGAKPSSVFHHIPTPLLRTAARLPSPCPITSQDHLPKPDKWGTVIYRCTYKDDQAWNRFKHNLQSETQGTIEFYKRTTEPITENHEWRFVEDRALLEGASKAQLRERFKQWRIPQVAKDPEYPRRQDGEPYYYAQYRYFIQVDEQPLKDIQDWGWDGGSVNLVDADWLPLMERWPNEEYKDDDDEFVYAPIEGCTEDDVGWMMIAGPAIDAKLLGEEMCDELWHLYYRRPDDILYYT